jgi:hypothetical protein
MRPNIKQIRVYNLLHSVAFTFVVTSCNLGFAQDDRENSIGLFVEPALTYETSQSSISYPSPLSTSSGKVEGFGVGARLGLHIEETFFAALDARFSMPQFQDSSWNSSAKATGYNWGPVIGMQIPVVGMRLWASYIFGGELDPEKSNNLNVKFAKANGYRVGAGFHILMFSLNLEYQDLKYGQATLEEIGPFTTNTNFDSVSLSNQSWIASLSFPLDL